MFNIELPPEYRSRNDVPVTRATITRERMTEILRAARNQLAPSADQSVTQVSNADAAATSFAILDEVINDYRSKIEFAQAEDNDYLARQLSEDWLEPLLELQALLTRRETATLSAASAHPVTRNGESFWLLRLKQYIQKASFTAPDEKHSALMCCEELQRQLSKTLMPCGPADEQASTAIEVGQGVRNYIEEGVAGATLSESSDTVPSDKEIIALAQDSNMPSIASVDNVDTVVDFARNLLSLYGRGARSADLHINLLGRWLNYFQSPDRGDGFDLYKETLVALAETLRDLPTIALEAISAPTLQECGVDVDLLARHGKALQFATCAEPVQWTEAMANAAFEALENRGFRVTASDLAMQDVEAMFRAIIAAAPAKEVQAQPSVNVEPTLPTAAHKREGRIDDTSFCFLEGLVDQSTYLEIVATADKLCKEAVATHPHIPHSWCVKRVGEAIHIMNPNGQWSGYMRGARGGPAHDLTYDFLCALLISAPEEHVKPDGEKLNAQLAAEIHYPDCWDLAAYPSLEDALSEVYAHFRCTNDECSQPDPAMTDKGPWIVGQNKIDKRIYLQSDNFTHDVRLYVDGDFGSDVEKIAYAKEMAEQLNACSPTGLIDTQDGRQARQVANKEAMPCALATQPAASAEPRLWHDDYKHDALIFQHGKHATAPTSSSGEEKTDE